MILAPVGFVGAGKVGCSLARYLQREPMLRRPGFLSKSAEHAREAAEFCEGFAYESLADLARDCRLIFLTVPDGAIREVAEELAGCGVDLAGKIVVHCSGATSSEALSVCRDAGAHVASMHPLYAVSSRFDCWQELGRAWFTLEGDDEAVCVLEAALDRLGNKHARIDAADKVRYHAAAVMASNLVVGLYHEAAAQLAACGLSQDDAEAALAALFLGNAEHVAHDGYATALTGPAARGDTQTIEAHLSCLSGDDRQIYQLLTNVLYRIAAQRQRNYTNATRGESLA